MTRRSALDVALRIGGVGLIAVGLAALPSQLVYVVSRLGGPSPGHVASEVVAVRLLSIILVVVVM